MHIQPKLEVKINKWICSYTWPSTIMSVIMIAFEVLLMHGLYLWWFLVPRLRALSRGGSVTSPPPSPAMPKSKLADYRYGREEMLALYIKDNKVSLCTVMCDSLFYNEDSNTGVYIKDCWLAMTNGHEVVLRRCQYSDIFFHGKKDNTKQTTLWSFKNLLCAKYCA